ncbi:MAG TPA: GerMN domain-containing protein [bacterium]|nr:GerMN domain-containing protein [bacterium]
MSRQYRRSGVTRGARRRGRPVLGWLFVIAVLVAAAVIVGRAVRVPLPGRHPAVGPPQAEVQVFLVRTEPGGRAQTLIAVRRRVPEGPEEALAAEALRALLDGPMRAERSHSLTSEIPSGTVLRSLTLSGGVATVDLGVTFAQGGGSSSILARVWQVVYTATQFPDVSSVQFLIGGRRVAALGGEGLMIGAPMRRPASVPTF